MNIELHCRHCGFQFAAPAHSLAEEVMDRMNEKDVWIALASGTTFEEMLSVALLSRGKISCPECPAALSL
jgi:hypothetical protein